MVTLPQINVTFSQLATSLIERSQRGIAVLIVRDATKGVPSYAVYNGPLTSEQTALYTATNKQAIDDVLSFAPYQLVVVAIGSDGVAADALAIVEKNVSTGWITFADGSEADFTALASWTKAKEQANKTYKAVVHKATAPDCRHIVNFYNDSVTFADDRAQKGGQTYCPSLIGILASANVDKGVTYFVCNNLSYVQPVEDEASAVGAGKFILMNDVDIVRIAQGINSLTTTNGSTLTEDMMYIETVEAMDMIADDIRSTFRNTYLGNYKNSYDNQILLISAINGYFNSLEGLNILDSNYDNVATVDVDAQRAAWVASGKAEASAWDDTQVKNNTFKRDVFLKGDIKILGSMTNLMFAINIL